MAVSDVKLASKPAGKGLLAGGKVRSDNLRPAEVDPERPFPTSRGVLSSAEIEALLRPDLPEPDPAPRQVDDKPIPDLQDAAEPDGGLSLEAAERLASACSLAVHQASGLALAFNLLEMRRAAFRQALPAPDAGTAYACFADASGDVVAMLVLSPAVSAAMIDALCGASSEHIEHARPRALTDIDMALIERAVGGIAARLPGGSLTLACLEGRPAFATALCPPGMASVIELNVRLDGLTSSAMLVLADGLEAVETPEVSAGEADARVGGLTALLTARIASLSVPVSRVANLKPGDTLLLGLPADEPVQLLSGGRDGAVVAEGQIGRKGKRMAVKVTQRGGALR